MKSSACSRFVAISCLFLSAGAMAQTCTTPFAQPTSGTADNTCAPATGHGSNSIGTYCGAFSHSGNEIVYNMTINNPTATQITVTPAASFDVAVTLIANSSGTADCQAANACTRSYDLAGAGAAENLILGADAANGYATAVANGNYYFVVSSTYDPIGQSSCGAYTISYTGTLPVQLQNFSVD